MVKVNYVGVSSPEREFGNLRDAYNRLRDLQGSCTPMGEDYMVLGAALDAFKAAAVHFTKDRYFYGGRPH